MSEPVSKPICIAIFCSGNGSNAQKIMEYFKTHPHIRIVLLVSNNAGAYALERAKSFGVESLVVCKSAFFSPDFAEMLQNKAIDFIVLAGFLWLLPAVLITTFKDKIINIHPALLPNFGGKGMYGIRVHDAVKASGTLVSGISIHLADAQYDQGQILFQASVILEPSDTPAQIAEKVLCLEHTYYAQIIENYIDSKF